MSYSSEGKCILVIRRQGISQSHTTQQTLTKRLIEKGVRGWLPLLRQEASGNQAGVRLYIGFLGGKGFQGGGLWGEDWWDFKSNPKIGGISSPEL